MALEHAILVSLLEKPGSGYELARRFERSIGYFWTATHQQIYRVLKRMEADGWIGARDVPQRGRPDKKEYSVSAAGLSTLTGWLGEPVQPESVRHELAVKLRGAAFGDPAALTGEVERHRRMHRDRLAHYLAGQRRDFGGGGTAEDPGAEASGPEDLDPGRELQHAVLRGGIAYERMMIAWLDDVLATLHRLSPRRDPGPSGGRPAQAGPAPDPAP
ncbi:PadR family transcriptional regulator [Streptomyces verrucosisporus]|uniref:PadR family transcriptional regulator n=1 Tax=Streptomyces verrucosisporus TaxID=1695161 RepID=UPI0019D2B1D6|nr:PadR family transcriptional regulator [Streptomyces verrucosisporus]MBN3932116.1 PadR family transcriptional regulator [Streptomyces verrucosisporus]